MKIYGIAVTATIILSLINESDGFAGLGRSSSALKPLCMSPLPKTHKDVLWTPSIKTGARDTLHGPITSYAQDLYSVIRRPTRSVSCGPISFGSDHPIVRQTMGTTETGKVQDTIAEVMRCADTGFDLVRITVQGKREAEAAMRIREGLFKKGYDIPLCADMHFQPKVAMMVAECLEKIRINPGNFADGRKDFEEKVYETEEEYISEREYLFEAMIPLVEKCKELNRAMRIGTNHGSLSSRVLSFYGDTPRGMVESALEFADICRSQDYHNFLFSMKASNPLVMVQSYRLLAAEMNRLEWDYPIHLGVTEAGEGEDGRMKSAIGIGTLLSDGIGDTIRVSLTEDPEFEYDPCNNLANMAAHNLATNPISATKQKATKLYVDSRDITNFARRKGLILEKSEHEAVDASGFLCPDGSVISVLTPSMLSAENAPYLYAELGCKTAVGMPFKDIATSDSVFLRKIPKSTDTVARTALRRLVEVSVGLIVPVEELRRDPLPNSVAYMTLEEAVETDGELPPGAIRLAVTIDGDESDETLAQLKILDPAFIFLNISPEISTLHASRRIFETLKSQDIQTSVIHHYQSTFTDGNSLALDIGMDVGSLLTDGLGDGLMIEEVGEEQPFALDFLRKLSFSVLQGCRMRSTKTEFVSCPSCGRTLFDLQETTAKITESTGHLPGVTVAVMGCIVNGPGEMADADFGYVGTVPGKIDLYYGKEVVRKSVKEAEAVEALVDLIKEYGMWKEKEEEEEKELAVAV